MLCFVAGTKVRTPDGDRNIKDIAVGEEVWSCDAETGETGSKHVTRLSVNEAGDIARVTIDGETIDATTTHPFYVEGYGFKPAGELLAGEKVRLMDGGTGEVEAVTVEHLEEPVKVYNFEVEDWHTYYVAELGVLVHNEGCGVTNPYDLTPTHSQTKGTSEMKKFINEVSNNGIDDTIKYVEYNGQKYIVDGHHRVIAAKRLGMKEVPTEQVHLPYAGYKTIQDLLWPE